MLWFRCSEVNCEGWYINIKRYFWGWGCLRFYIKHLLFGSFHVRPFSLAKTQFNTPNRVSTHCIWDENQLTLLRCYRKVFMCVKVPAWTFHLLFWKYHLVCLCSLPVFVSWTPAPPCCIHPKSHLLFALSLVYTYSSLSYFWLPDCLPRAVTHSVFLLVLPQLHL